MALPYGPDGRLWPLGSVSKTKSTDLEDGALPSWLTPGTGIASVAPSTEPAGGVQVTSTTTTDAVMSVRGPAIDLAQPRLRAIQVEVVFTGQTQTNKTLDIGFIGANETSAGWTAGAYLRITGGAAATNTVPSWLRAVGPGPVVTQLEAGYPLAGGPSGPWYMHRLSILVTLADFQARHRGGLYLLAGDEVWKGREFGDGLSLGTVHPGIRWTNNGSTPFIRHVHQFSVTQWWE